MQSAIRAFDPARDLDAIKRIWQEVGWTTEASEVAQLDHFFGCGSTMVGTLDDVPECSVHIAPGSLRLQATDLQLCAVTAVTTSRVARGQAFAQRLTALQLAAAAEQGAQVAALGMFDQGFYDKLGFGTAAYDHRFSLDPGSLKVNARVPPPRRLTAADYPAMHAALMQRHRVHGSVTLFPPTLFRAELGFDDTGFGLGYETAGELSHFVWLTCKGEHGPYDVRWLCYRDTAQLVELLGLLKSLADQVYSLTIMEPPEIQLQSLIERPFRQRMMTRNSTFGLEHRAMAWAQFRVLDVAACVAALSLPTEIAFNLQLSDPARDILVREAAGWSGVTGQYVIRLGAQSAAREGVDKQLPTLVCDVRAFTRLIWGVAPASSLAVTDDFACPAPLIEQLDERLQLPVPKFGWDF